MGMKRSWLLLSIFTFGTFAAWAQGDEKNIKPIKKVTYYQIALSIKSYDTIGESVVEKQTKDVYNVQIKRTGHDSVSEIVLALKSNTVFTRTLYNNMLVVVYQFQTGKKNTDSKYTIAYDNYVAAVEFFVDKKVRGLLNHTTGKLIALNADSLAASSPAAPGFYAPIRTSFSNDYFNCLLNLLLLNQIKHQQLKINESATANNSLCFGLPLAATNVYTLNKKNEQLSFEIAGRLNYRTPAWSNSYEKENYLSGQIKGRIEKLKTSVLAEKINLILSYNISSLTPSRTRVVVDINVTENAELD
jgi:hypothetical protein